MTVEQIIGGVYDEEARLERFWLYCIFAAGKNADLARGALNRLLYGIDASPFTYLEYLLEESYTLHNALVASKIGQYTRIERAIKGTVELLRNDGGNEISIRDATIEQLESIHGVGPKTARFFALHARGEEVAVLDVHVLRWMREVCGFRDLPTRTPQSGPRYRQIEKQFLALAKSHFPCITVADADLLIWSRMSGRLEGEDLNV
jgi:thermostable 8-oxoguanine DNA glycosylase